MYVRFVLVRIFGYILITQDSSDILKHYPTRTFRRPVDVQQGGAGGLPWGRG